jgi:hypothetical protein
MVKYTIVLIENRNGKEALSESPVMDREAAVAAAKEHLGKGMRYSFEPPAAGTINFAMVEYHPNRNCGIVGPKSFERMLTQ